MGIIPARAGSTHKDARGLGRPQDHPRSCGEHAASIYALSRSRGSSSLVRGALSREVAAEEALGIIPARAGSTFMDFKRESRFWDHPRSCGEHLEYVEPIQPCQGSSPLVRGAPRRHVDAPRRQGIIPARAGSTYPLWPGPWKTEDHPRSCGEHSPVLESHAADLGSSPLVRGALRLQICGRVGLGIIPARAGSTYISSLIFAIARDHPRSCGEHNAGPSLSHAHAESSPLVRGAPLC